MRTYGKKKTRSNLPGHGDCTICHPEQKNSRARGRRDNDYFDGFETVPCTCSDECPQACPGDCGCKACRTAYADVMSSRDE